MKMFFYREKRVIDLDKPLLTGAFVDPSKIAQYTEKDYILPEIPPFSWLIQNQKVGVNICWLVLICTIWKKINYIRYFQKETKNVEINENENENENEKGLANNGNIDSSGSPDSRKMLINNNNININNNKNLNNNNVNGNDEKNDSLTKKDRFRFGSAKTLSREEDRILKEMVSRSDQFFFRKVLCFIQLI